MSKYLDVFDVEKVVKILVSDKSLAKECLAQLPCKSPLPAELPRWSKKAPRTQALQKRRITFSPAEINQVVAQLCSTKINTGLCLGNHPLPVAASLETEVAVDTRPVVATEADSDIIDDTCKLIKMQSDVSERTNSDQKSRSSPSLSSVLSEIGIPEKQVVLGVEAVASFEKVSWEPWVRLLFDLNAPPPTEGQVTEDHKGRVDAGQGRVLLLTTASAQAQML